jgi:hypothetical protein
MSAERWHICSRILTECRRLRAFSAELRATISVMDEPATRHALEQYARSLEHASALGDVAAAALDRRSPER